MGCSPSKGKLFSKPVGPGPQRDLLAEAPQDGVDSGTEENEKCLETDETNETNETNEPNEPNEKVNDLPLLSEEHPTKETAWPQVASDTTGDQNADGIEETEDNVTPQEIINEVVPTDNITKVEKRKKNKGKRRSIKKDGKTSIVQTKFDFPPHMVRAHQAAYAFLNPNISKYEALLGLLDQAAQTQLSMQPPMSALVLRFEEINQALEEMAEEGELMLKEHGDYMALFSGMMGPALMPIKPCMDSANPPHPPPDLVQQLLQHSAEKMRLVGGSVKALGDTTLREAVEYFSSLSKLLVEKLQAKQAAEQRLVQVLARVEKAGRFNPEDSSLHSEDSGIGGENESLTGSERHRRHRGSAGSGSCESGSNIRGANLLNQVGYNEDDEEDEEEDDDDDDDEEYEDDECDRPERKRSNSSPPDPSQPLLFMCANYLQDRRPTVKRSLTSVTSTKPEISSSAKCVSILMELQKSQRVLDEKMNEIAEIRGKKQSVGAHYNLYRVGLRRHSVSGSGAQKGPFRTNTSPGSLPVLAPQPPKHQSVRRLINTFSQGVDGRPGQSLANIPPHIRRPRKSMILQLSDAVNTNNNNSWPEGRDDLDVDNLPPPPPEVLMDNSFQRTDGIPGNKAGSPEDSSLTLPIINQKTGVSQRLKASVQNVELLPNRASMRPRVISILPARPVRQNAVMGVQEAEQQRETELDPEMEKIPRCDSNEFYEGEMSSYSPPVTAPPVSRVRLPPSGPSVCHRIPRPPASRPQSTSRPSSRPSSPIPVARATDNNTEEIIPSVSFRDARSVFCRKDSQIGSSLLPKPWGEASRGRISTRGTDNSRRTQSEQRPSSTSHSEFSKDGCSASTQAKESEPFPT